MMLRWRWESPIGRPAGNGPTTCHRLGTPASPAPRLTRPSPTRPPVPPGRTVEPGAHPSTIGPVTMPKMATCADHDPGIQTIKEWWISMNDLGLWLLVTE